MKITIECQPNELSAFMESTQEASTDDIVSAIRDAWPELESLIAERLDESMKTRGFEF